MEKTEARLILTKLSTAMAVMAKEDDYAEQVRRDNFALKAAVKDLRAENDKLFNYQTLYNKLVAASPVCICPQCEGAGGFYFDMGEQGTGGEQCGLCEGCGIIDKKDIPAPIVPTETTSKSLPPEDDLPY